MQTETVLRQALAERVKPCLFCNKVDRCILELQMEPEDMYSRFRNALENVNMLVATYNDELMGDVQLAPEKALWQSVVACMAGVSTSSGPPVGVCIVVNVVVVLVLAGAVLDFVFERGLSPKLPLFLMCYSDFRRLRYYSFVLMRFCKRFVVFSSLL